MKNLSDKGKMHSTQTVDCCVGLDYWNTIQVSGKNAGSATTNNRFQEIIGGLPLTPEDRKVLHERMTTFVQKVRTGALVCGDESDDYADWAMLFI